MNETTPAHEPTVIKPWYRKELFVFIAGSIVIAFFLVVISMALYISSGASLLDASKPGFKPVQNEVDQSDNFEAFSATGSVNAGTLNQFQQLYEKQVKPVTNSSAYDSTPLSDQALGLDDVSPDATAP